MKTCTWILDRLMFIETVLLDEWLRLSDVKLKLSIVYVSDNVLRKLATLFQS